MDGLHYIIIAAPCPQPDNSPRYAPVWLICSSREAGQRNCLGLVWFVFWVFLTIYIFYTDDGCSWPDQVAAEFNPASCSGRCTLSTERTIFQDPILRSRSCFPLNGRNKGEHREERRHPKIKSVWQTKNILLFQKWRCPRLYGAETPAVTYTTLALLIHRWL